MTWNKQTETMMDIWLDAQKTIWESWNNTARSTSNPALFYTGIVEQWRKAIAQGFESWTIGAEPLSKNMSRQILTAQATTMRFLEFSVNAWQGIVPKLETGQDWQGVLRTYTEQFSRHLMPAPGGALQVSQDMGELWKIYLTEMQEIVRPWAESLGQAPGHFSDALIPNGGSELIELTNLYWDAYERTFGRIAESPRMGFTRELDEKLLRGFDTWTAFRRASADYQLVLAKAWSRVFEQVMHELVARAGKGQPIQNLKEWLRLWTEVADRELEEVFSSEAYLQAQQSMFNTAMQYRLREQDIVETYLKTSYIPTRSELDEVHHTIYELRKEIKALKKELRAARAARAEAPALPQPQQEAPPPPARKRPPAKKTAKAAANNEGGQ